MLCPFIWQRQTGLHAQHHEPEIQLVDPRLGFWTMDQFAVVEGTF